MNDFNTRVEKINQTLQRMVNLKINTDNNAECSRNFKTLMAESYILEIQIKEATEKLKEPSTG